MFKWIHDNSVAIVATCAIVAFVVAFVLLIAHAVETGNDYDASLYQKGYLDACRDHVRNTVKAKLIKNDAGEATWQYTGGK